VHKEREEGREGRRENIEKLREKNFFFIKVGERYGSRWVIQALPPFF
jgi:hypothetical protein